MGKCKKGQKWDEKVRRCIDPFLTQETVIGLIVAIGFFIAGIITAVT